MKKIPPPTKNLSILYSKQLNVGLSVLVRDYPDYPHIDEIRTRIRNCRSLTAIFNLLNNFKLYEEIMI